MLQAHSFLWHYLWLAPAVLQLAVALLLWRRGMHRQFPVFCCYLLFGVVETAILYGFDVSSTVSPQAWWFAYCAFLMAESVLKLAVIAELLRHLLQHWSALARMMRSLVGAVGVALVFFATVAAALREPNRTPWLIWAAHGLSQSFYIVLAGLIVSVLLLSVYFNVKWDKITFGIALGFGVYWCEHLAAWAVTAGRALDGESAAKFDMANMATYHLTVLIWLYYALATETVSEPSAGELPDHRLDVWNRELERLLQS
jgi:hypothetical protein